LTFQSCQKQIQKQTIDTDKANLEDTNVKVYLTKIEGGVEEELLSPTLISELEKDGSNYILYQGENIHKNGNKAVKKEYRLRAWIDEEVDPTDFNTQTHQYKFSINVNASMERKPLGTEMLIAKVGTEGLIKEEHPRTSQLKATTAYRYTGANPNNYIKFNNETWRIIGIFDTDDGTGKIEKRIKISGSLGNIVWDNESNDWTQSSLMTLLNSGAYYNRTGGYTTNGLTEEAKNQIADAKWYLGGTEQHYLYLNTIQFYDKERGTTVYSGRPTSWIGKVGLIYPSDYGYATSGGNNIDRTTCLENMFNSWRNASDIDCKNNNWLTSGINQWTMTPVSSADHYVNYIYVSGNGNSAYWVATAYQVRPTVYLKASIKLSGDGTSTSPYEIIKDKK